MGALLLAAFLGTAALPLGVAETTVLDLTVANPHFSDFEDGGQGWTASDVPDVPPRPAPVSTWAWGAPTSGPGGAASGANVWATNLAGNYTTNECAGLMTPAIDLTAASSASIALKHWRHFEQSTSTGTGWDAGVMMVTADGGQTFTRINATGYTSNSVSSTTRTCWDGAPTTARGWTGPVTAPAPTYTTDTANLDAFVGQTIQVVFAWGSDGSIVRAGWYVDDVAVTVDGVTNVQDFESSDGGFTLVGTKVAPTNVPFGWEHGVPTGGPASTSPMWATNIDGKYGSNECAWLESPAFEVGPLPNESAALLTATLSWSQWFRSGSTTGAGVVQIGTSDGYTIVAPDGGYPAKPTSTILDACLGHLAPGLGAYAGLIDTVGAPMTEFQADISEYLGKEITVRFLFASTSSTTTYEGWYVDDVNVNVRAVVAVPDPEDIGDGAIPGTGANAPLWTSGGPVNSWAYGVATNGPVGATTYKTNLDGVYAEGECSYIQSPAVPGALFALDPSLSFEHWHRIPGTSVNVPWAAGIVLASVDGGMTWQHVAMPDYNKNVYEPPTYTEIFDNCLSAWGADSAMGGYGKASTAVAGNVDGWYTSSVDLSSLAGAPTVQVRFAFASDGTFEYEGWAIRAVTLGGTKVL